MATVEQQILSVLELRLSRLTARSVLRRATASLGVSPNRLEPSHVPALTCHVEQGIRLFADREYQEHLIEKLRGLVPAHLRTGRLVELEAESDIVQVRVEARDVALQFGANTFTQQRIVTAASELARNIVLYAGSGTIELGACVPPATGVRVVARDAGPGIANVDRVLSGQYRSKTGLGRGLLAVRRVADAFDLKTGSTGTVVRAEFLT